MPRHRVSAIRTRTQTMSANLELIKNTYVTGPAALMPALAADVVNGLRPPDSLPPGLIAALTRS